MDDVIELRLTSDVYTLSLFFRPCYSTDAVSESIKFSATYLSNLSVFFGDFSAEQQYSQLYCVTITLSVIYVGSFERF